MRFLILTALVCCADISVESVPPTFDPDLALLASVDAGAQRWAQATGRDDIRLERGGIPVTWEEDLKSIQDDGSVLPACGQTRVTFFDGEPVDIQIVIDPTPPADCSPIEVTVLHEIAHALNPHARHAEAGLFASHATGNRIDGGALSAVCGGFECIVLVPE